MDNVEKIREAIVEKEIKDDMESSFLQYAMSVITSRAIPDARDGLKPVNRRIIYAMNSLGLTSDKQFKKSSRVVGEVIGKYHPHGEASIYGSLVHLAQVFSTKYPLAWGHGNFGSVDGDPPAAQRYTEIKMAKISNELVRDINKDTVDFKDNYDGSEKEPSVLPAYFPNLLANGTFGIAVGMATHIPSHNIGEICNAAIALAKNPDISDEELLSYVNGPDFPTGGEIIGDSGIRNAYLTGYGKYVIKSVYEIKEATNGQKVITFSEIPFNVKKSQLIEKLGELDRDKRITDIVDVKDESSHDTIKITMIIKRKANVEVFLNQLFKMTDFQKTYNINMLALHENRPKLLTLRSALQIFIDHLKVVITRRTIFDLKKAEARLHILEGLIKALTNIDEIIQIIKDSKSKIDASERLIIRFNFTEIQTKAILEMQLQTLSGLEKNRIETEHHDIQLKVADYKDILGSEERLTEIFTTSQEDIIKRFSKERETKVLQGALIDLTDEEAMEDLDVFISVTKNGYFKRLQPDTFRTQRRGGKGINAVSLYGDDYSKWLLSAKTKSRVLFFTNQGKVYHLKAYELPLVSREAKGTPISYVIENMSETKETLTEVLTVDKVEDIKELVFVTKNGLINKTLSKELEKINKNGKICINLDEGDEVVSVLKAVGNEDVVIATTENKLVRFSLSEVRLTGRNTRGCLATRLPKGEGVVNATLVGPDSEVVIIFNNGKAKKLRTEDIRKIKRGGKGVLAINRKFKLSIFDIKKIGINEDLILNTKNGKAIRISLNELRTLSRNAVGSNALNFEDNDEIVGAELIQNLSEEEEIENELNEEGLSVSRETIGNSVIENKNETEADRTESESTEDKEKNN